MESIKVYEPIKKGNKVFTRLGKGIVVHVFTNRTYAVEFEYGGGAILPSWDIFSPHAVPEPENARDLALIE